MKKRPILKECGCQDNQMPGFGGALRSNSNNLMPMGNENPHAGEIQFVPVTFDTREQLTDFVREIIRKVGDHYELKSHSGKTLGRGTEEEMEKRERQVNYFKHKGK
jgi:hypothetical protein